MDIYLIIKVEKEMSVGKINRDSLILRDENLIFFDTCGLCAHEPMIFQISIFSFLKKIYYD